MSLVAASLLLPQVKEDSGCDNVDETLTSFRPLSAAESWPQSFGASPSSPSAGPERSSFTWDLVKTTGSLAESDEAKPWRENLPTLLEGSPNSTYIPLSLEDRSGKSARLLKWCFSRKVCPTPPAFHKVTKHLWQDCGNIWGRLLVPMNCKYF